MLKKMVVAALLVLGQQGVQAGELPAYPFVHVNGMGAMYAPPDIGEIEFEVAAYDADPARAHALVAQRVTEIRAHLACFGIEGEDVAVRDVRKEMRNQALKGDGTPEAPLYDIKCNVKITVRTLAQWAQVVGPLLDMPNLADFSTAFDTVERDKIEATLAAQAIVMARKKAEGLAAGLGRKLGPATAVTNGELKNVTRAMGLAASDPIERRGAARTEVKREGLLVVDTIKLAQPVDVIYRIK
ncbi:MAG: SIMPL domain-containing protein [Gammaproteobacteria bacterium]